MLAETAMQCPDGMAEDRNEVFYIAGAVAYNGRKEEII